MSGLALILALDGSASVGFEEFNDMTRGLAAALRDAEVVASLTATPSQLALLLWSGAGAQEVMLDWTAITGPAQAEAFAQAVADLPRTVRAGTTAIGEALLACEALLAAPGLGARRMIDVAGDGRSNDGLAPGPVRDRLAATGVTINGLCVLHEEPDLLASYTAEVVGGPGHFAVVCTGYDSFAEAMRRKLLQETA